MEDTKKEGISFEIKNPMLLLFLAFGITVLILELLLILNKPIAFGDDAYHAYISKYIGTSLTFPKILPGFNIYYTYSPLLHIFLSVFYFFPFGEILVKTFIPCLVFLVGLGVFVTVSKVLSRRVALIAAIITITLPSFVTYSVLIYTDILMVLFFSLSVMLTLIAEKYNSKKYWFLAIIFAGLSYITKTYGLMAFIFIGIVLLYKLKKRDFTFRKFLLAVLFSICISLIVLGGWFIRNISLFQSLDCNLPIGTRNNCILEPISQDTISKFAGYVIPLGSNLGITSFGIKNFISFSYGIIWFVPFISIAGIIYLILKRERISDIMLILIVPILILAVVTGIVNIGEVTRVEDLARAFLSSVFVLGLISAYFLDSVIELTKKYSKYLQFFIIGTVIILSWFNFKDKLDVMSNVKNFSPYFFQACDYIKNNTEKDSIFLSLWSAPTTYNCERSSRWESNYLPDILLTWDLTKILDGLKAQNVSYIFIQKFAMSQTPYRTSIPVSFVQFLENNPINFEKIYENGPGIQDCINQGGCDGTIVYRINYNE